MNVANNDPKFLNDGIFDPLLDKNLRSAACTQPLGDEPSMKLALEKSEKDR